MITSPDLADLIAYAQARGAKIILAGDTSQLQAVENGGGMSLLASALGYARLAEPVRFRAAWEQQASLRLREGDTTILADYDQHARIHGGEPEQMMDAAAAAYVALTADGTDTLLMAADHTLRRELNRRIRDDLIPLGLVQDGPAVTIADGTKASPGDLIIATQNDRTVEAGESGRTLANGDLLRIDAITRKGLIVRRALDTDPQTGQRRWTDRHFLFADYENAELGYAVTDHTAQGRTVHTGLAVITGTEDRQHAYVALTRGTDVNTAYVFTLSPKIADPAPGPRPAPELARYDRRTTAPGGQPATRTQEALAVLAGVLERDGQQQSATQTRQRALSDADHLALLHAIWTAETTPARDQRYRGLLTQALPPGYRTPPGHQARWLWRTLRAAELAGLDPAEVLAAAIGERDLTGARDIPAVIDNRLRHRLGSLVPLPPGPWSAQLPAIADPERRAYAAQIAALMDARKDRIGEHAADNALPWAVSALGPVPDIPWTGWSGSSGPPRSAPGGNYPATPTPTDPIGPEPAAAPDLRAAWHEALAALGPVDGPDVRGLPDGTLLHLRDTYPIETGWAPQWTGEELRQVRRRRRRRPARRLRASADPTPPTPGPARNAARAARAGRQLPGRARRLPRTRDRLRRHHGRPDGTGNTATRQQRQLAVAADGELRRRHPGQPYPPLRSAEPEPATEPSATSSP